MINPLPNHAFGEGSSALDPRVSELVDILQDCFLRIRASAGYVKGLGGASPHDP